MTGFKQWVMLLAALSGACASTSSHSPDVQVTSTSGGAPSTNSSLDTGGTPAKSIDLDAGRPGCDLLVDSTQNNAVFVCPAKASAQWPFVSYVVTSDAVSTATFDNPEPGKLCMSGVVAKSGPSGANWGAFLGLNFVTWNADRTAVLGWFDAKALGITQFKFTLESPPPEVGIAIGVNMVTHTECPDSLCSSGGRFRLMTGDTSFAYLTPGVKGPLPFSAFVQPPWETSTLTLDTSKLFGLNFIVMSTEDATIDYNFCVSDVKFLDANGNEVIDPKLRDGGP